MSTPQFYLPKQELNLQPYEPKSYALSVELFDGFIGIIYDSTWKLV
ncbi:MAG: hypothetical protein ACW964_09875 [Candidatus Hodarchaeales archaeon]